MQTRPTLLLVLLFLHKGSTNRCYCTDDHCVPYGVCESKWCLVGIRKDTNSVIRTCGTEQSAKVAGTCRRNFGRWSDLCACEGNFCNTFAFLREQMRKQRYLDVKTQPDDPVPRFVQTPKSILKTDAGEALVHFQRVDFPSDDYEEEANRDMKNAPLSTRNSMLTLLLVVVPLTVGAATVLVVAVNYYCHLC